MIKKSIFLLFLGLMIGTIASAQTMKENLFNMVSRSHNEWKSEGTDVDENGVKFDKTHRFTPSN